MSPKLTLPERASRPTAFRRRSGTAALEFVIVLPVLLVVVVGATDLGRVMYFENVLSNAAREGAAYGATHQYTDYTYDNWETRVDARTREEAAHLPAFDDGLLTVDIDAEEDLDGSRRVRVDVVYPFELIIHWPGWPNQITLSRHVTMRAHR